MGFIVTRTSKAPSSKIRLGIISLLASTSLIVLGLGVGGVISLGVGSKVMQQPLMFDSAVDAQLASAPVARVNPSKSLQRQAATIWAAYQSYVWDTGEEPGSIQELSPGYIPSVNGTAPTYLQKWHLVDAVLFTPITQSQCNALSINLPDTVVSGAAGLHCTTSLSPKEKGAKKEYYATYRYTEAEDHAASIWHVSLKGALREGITSWKMDVIKGAPSQCDYMLTRAALYDTQTSTVELSEPNPAKEWTVCMHSHGEEQTELSEGLSITKGKEAIQLALYTESTPWEIALSASSCLGDSGALAKLTISRQDTKEGREAQGKLLPCLESGVEASTPRGERVALPDTYESFFSKADFTTDEGARKRRR